MIVQRPLILLLLFGVASFDTITTVGLARRLRDDIRSWDVESRVSHGSPSMTLNSLNCAFSVHARDAAATVPRLKIGSSRFGRNRRVLGVCGSAEDVRDGAAQLRKSRCLWHAWRSKGLVPKDQNVGPRWYNVVIPKPPFSQEFKHENIPSKIRVSIKYLSTVLSIPGAAIAGTNDENRPLPICMLP